MIPGKESLTIGFAHRVYRLAERFAARSTGIAHFEVRSAAELAQRVHEADVLVVSMLWHDALAARAARLRFIQSISAGTDQFGRDALRTRGIRLASAAGVNAQAVAEHAMAMILALTRRLPEARDNQRARHWRAMIPAPEAREDQLTGKTILIVGLGHVGTRLVRLAKAFDMRVNGIRRQASLGAAGADSVFGHDDLHDQLRAADLVVLACPLSAETENLIDARALAAMKPTAVLVNVARGAVVDEAALIEALQRGRLAGAGLDVVREEPLSAASPLWGMPNVLLTPHAAGETRRYEDAVIDILLENLARLWRGEPGLLNQVV